MTCLLNAGLASDQYFTASRKTANRNSSTRGEEVEEVTKQIRILVVNFLCELDKAGKGLVISRPVGAHPFASVAFGLAPDKYRMNCPEDCNI